MKSVLFPANERGHADHGWLNAKHSFSFASWYHPGKMHFGMLRVLNDDIIAGGMGFGMHPHNDMEIITIILEGALEHRDDMGNGSVIRPGDVQVMSAGTGVFHSEFNPDENHPAKLFQLWIFPKEKNITPRYDQKSFEVSQRLNGYQTVASGFSKGDELYIHQDAALSLSKIESGKSINYPIAQQGNGAYIMVINGEARIQGVKTAARDAVGIWETDLITIEGITETELLIVDVPMH